MTLPHGSAGEADADALDADDAAAIAAAEAALAALASEYPGYAAADLQEMERAFDALWARFEGAAGAVDCGREAEAVFSVAHNVKGQGASFGYDLMSEIAESLCALLRDRTTLDLAEAEAAGAHVAALGEVLEKRLTGDGGDEGRALLDGLRPARAAVRRA